MPIPRPVENLSVQDTFASWVDKINTALPGDFNIDYDLSDGLSLVVKSGTFTDGSRIQTLPQTTLVLPVSSSLLIAVVTVETNPRFEVYIQGDISIPSANIIPVALVTTNATEITVVNDVRTWASVSGGGTSSEGVLLFNATIVRDQIIPVGKNALSVEPTIAEGVTVTVSEGSVWTVV